MKVGFSLSRFLQPQTIYFQQVALDVIHEFGMTIPPEKTVKDFRRPVIWWHFHMGYSDFKLFMGFAMADFTACQITVSDAIAIAASPETANIHHSTVIL